ncbi:hypothetical protein [Corynebacterium sp. HMSC11E11]|uniref:hypothetical protein n=1 Tax=Corynebacterium sp. HMSC11E11 TaxID=1581089 RepID=UPI000AAAB980|nr:hypothetical protein [Corynebacterium sp. HMSC11E11]
MSVNSLGEGQEFRMSARGMFQVQAHSLGSREPVRLELRGDADANRVDDSTLKVIGAGSSSQVVLRPVAGGDFGPGRSAQVIVTRGRPGTDSAQSIEFPRVTLDGRSEVVVGLIRAEGDDLLLRAEGLVAEGRLDGPAATVRAAVRSALDAASVHPAEGMAIRVHVDRSASMSAPSVLARLAPAVDVIVGAASVIPGTPRVTVVADGETRVLDSVADLAGEVRQLVQSGAARIGGGETVSDGMDDLTFVISDAVPAAVADGDSNAVSLLLRGASRHGSSTVVAVDDRLIDALESGRSDAIRSSVESVVMAMRRINDGSRGAAAPAAPAASEPPQAPARDADPFGGTPTFADSSPFGQAPAFGESQSFGEAPRFGSPEGFGSDSSWGNPPTFGDAPASAPASDGTAESAPATDDIVDADALTTHFAAPTGTTPTGTTPTGNRPSGTGWTGTWAAQSPSTETESADTGRDTPGRHARDAEAEDDGRRQAPVWPTSPTTPTQRPGNDIRPPMFGAPADDRSDEDDRR